MLKLVIRKALKKGEEKKRKRPKKIKINSQRNSHNDENDNDDDEYFFTVNNCWEAVCPKKNGEGKHCLDLKINFYMELGICQGDQRWTWRG